MEDRFTDEDARRIGEEIGVDWATAPFDVDQFRRGLHVELEHGLHDPATDVTGDDPILTGQDRSRSPERVPRLLHEARADGGGRGTRSYRPVAGRPQR
jgi:hypothetical protein